MKSELIDLEPDQMLTLAILDVYHNIYKSLKGIISNPSRHLAARYLTIMFDVINRESRMISSNQMCNFLGVTRGQAKRCLIKMESYGIITKIGYLGRREYYVLDKQSTKCYNDSTGQICPVERT